MKKIKKIVAAACALSLCLGACACAPPPPQKDEDAYTEIENFCVTDPSHMKRLGRVYPENGGLAFRYSASGFEFRFEGTSATIVIEAENSESQVYRPYLYVLTDGAMPQDGEPVALTEKVTSLQVKDLVNGLHTVRVLRSSEASAGKTVLKSVSVDGAFVTPKPPAAHKMLFFGDSITCGYGIKNSTEKDGFSTATEDALLTYAGLTATAFGADFAFVCASGIAMNKNIWDGSVNIPALLNVTDPYCATLWDHSSFVPDVAVINLGANDNTYINAVPNIRDMRQRIEEFIQVYADFLVQLRGLYPGITVYCTTGMLGEPMLPHIETAIGRAGAEGMIALQLPAMNKADGYGADNHPVYKTHVSAYEVLRDKITEISRWEPIF